MIYPSYLEGRVREVRTDDFVTVDICSGSGNELFEIYYFGEFVVLADQEGPYIVDQSTEDGDVPCLVVARDVATGEDLVLFDGARHGYNAMFCDEFNPNDIAARTLRRYPLAASRVSMSFGYSIDYDEEKDDYEVDEDDMVELISGETVSWSDVKRNGFDFLSITCVDEAGGQTEVASLELA